MVNRRSVYVRDSVEPLQDAQSSFAVENEFLSQYDVFFSPIEVKSVPHVFSELARDRLNGEALRFFQQRPEEPH